MGVQYEMLASLNYEINGTPPCYVVMNSETMAQKGGKKKSESNNNKRGKGLSGTLHFLSVTFKMDVNVCVSTRKLSSLHEQSWSIMRYSNYQKLMNCPMTLMTMLSNRGLIKGPCAYGNVAAERFGWFKERSIYPRATPKRTDARESGLCTFQYRHMLLRGLQACTSLKCDTCAPCSLGSILSVHTQLSFFLNEHS